ncbi:chloramphenicol acetyltransferase [Dysgonomonas sp. 521]|uniref:chloramphenicol acetyltransferase n=1 Tax=Dysgonomonas sp. 521 TaxID=2302932 RepID=UPI0013D50F35|nr:chloramphenicol acetyltransferase [Dysgonomonas sp. 521]NDV94321.1 chloramphenicol acetyltransferase [Dysgonomonas sp. 521]
MKRIIDQSTWNRKEHFDFFKDFDDPLFGVTVNVDFTTTYNSAKESGNSFFLTSLHRIMQAVNRTEEFRYRIEGDDVVCYDTIHATSTIGREDGTFGFSFMEYFEDRSLFIENALQVMNHIKQLSGITLLEQTDNINVIHYSPLPWVRFTDLKHPAKLGGRFSIPKISTGKLFEENGRLMLPMSITANHAVMDGFHVSRFLDNLNDLR